MIGISNTIDVLEFNSGISSNKLSNVKYKHLTIEEFIQSHASKLFTVDDDQLLSFDSFGDEYISISDYYGWSKLLKIIIHNTPKEMYKVTFENNRSVIVTKDQKFPLYDINEFHVGFHGLRTYNYQLEELDKDHISNKCIRSERTKEFDKSDFIKVSNIELVGCERSCEIFTKSNSFNVNKITMMTDYIY